MPVSKKRKKKIKRRPNALKCPGCGDRISKNNDTTPWNLDINKLAQAKADMYGLKPVLWCSDQCFKEKGAKTHISSEGFLKMNFHKLINQQG